MYEALILLSYLLNPSLENYASEIEKFYERSDGVKPNVKINGSELKIFFEDLEFLVVKNCHESVLKESIEIAQRAPVEERKKISEAHCRFELSSTEDVDMVYFNDFIFIIEAAQNLGEVWAYNPAQDELI